MLDQTAAPDATYRYRAERIRTLHVGRGSVVVRSEPTPAIEVSLRDTFPPEPPGGLASIPGSDSAPPSHPSIDLSWQPGAEADLGGYYVYRLDLGPAKPDTVPRRLTSEPLPGPAYRDLDVLAGENYEYRVTAVDQHGNESKPGAPIRESFAKPQ